MPDYSITPDPGTAAEEAVNYILQRIARDADFAWHMHGSRALDLCVRAEAERRGCSRNEVERWLQAECRRHLPWLEQHGAHEPREVVLEREIADLKDQLGDVDALAIAERRHDIECDRGDARERERCRDLCCGVYLSSQEEIAAGYCRRCLASLITR